MVITSNLISGGIENRLIGQVFSKETLNVIHDLAVVTGEKIKEGAAEAISEDDRLIQAIINKG
jgi:hypothetical protein